MLIDSIRKYQARELLLVLGVIFLSKSLYYESYGNNYLLVVFSLLVTILFNPSKVKADKKIILHILFFLFIVMLNGETEYDSVLVLIARFYIAIYVVYAVSFYRFSIIYVDTLLVISLFSFLSIAVVYFNTPSILNDFIATDGRSLRNFIFFAVSDEHIKYGIYRNIGLWWEPGAFQLFVNLAFFLGILNNYMSKAKYVLFFITILSINSSTGFIVFFLLSLAYFKNNNLFSGWNKAIFLLPLVMFLILNLNDKFVLGGVLSDSLLSRYYDVLISYNMFLDNIFLGYGFGSEIENAIPYGANLIGHKEYYSFVRPTGSDGLTMFIAQCGVMAFILIKPFLFPRYIRYDGIVSTFLFSSSLFILFNTQNFSYTLIFTVLYFYGVMGRKKMRTPSKAKTIKLDNPAQAKSNQQPTSG